MTILEAIRDPNLFAPWFRDRGTWGGWFALLAALFVLPMDARARSRFERCTGRKRLPTRPAREAWLAVGRRGGKSFIAALVAVFLACFRDYSDVLAPGERATVMVLAADRRQARVVMRYIGAFFEAPLLSKLVEKRTAEAIHLTNRISIEVHTANFRTVRGYTVVAAILDEVAFWRSDDSANPDTEIVNALRPAMATVPNSLLIGISSPYARRGVLWNAYKAHYGRDDSDVLVWQAPTRAMNPQVPQVVVDNALSEDPASAEAEYLAQFRRDVESFINREAIEAVVVPERRELGPLPNLRYTAFVDPSGGSQDSMTLAIAHAEDDRAVLDLVREVRPPFSPEAVVREFAATLKRYRVREVHGDRYGGEFCREPFRKAGLWYQPAEKPKSDLYRELLPAINSKRVELLDHPRLVAQLVGLERRTARGGRDTIDHAPRGHDDLANVCAGAVVAVLQSRPPVARIRRVVGMH